jgi:hypothetical protein
VIVYVVSIELTLPGRWYGIHITMGSSSVCVLKKSDLAFDEISYI